MYRGGAHEAPILAVHLQLRQKSIRDFGFRVSSNPKKTVDV